MNISSVVVQVMPKYVDEVVEALKKSEYCDYHLHDKEKGKIIITIEGEGVAEEIDKLKHIQMIPHVISAEMMMSYSEEELERERDKIEKQNPVPEILNKDDVKAEDIVYGGDVRNLIGDFKKR